MSADALHQYYLNQLRLNPYAKQTLLQNWLAMFRYGKRLQSEHESINNEKAELDIEMNDYFRQINKAYIK